MPGPETPTPRNLIKNKKIKEIRNRKALFKPIALYCGLTVDACAGPRPGLEARAWPDPGIHTLPSTMLQILIAAWSPVFTSQVPSASGAHSLLRKYSNSVQWDWSNCEPPSLACVSHYFVNSRDSAPGIDGVCNAAWRFGGDIPQAAVFRAHGELCNGLVPPVSHNDGLWLSGFFPPKK